MANANRNRVIFQSNAIFVGPTPATGAHFAVTDPNGLTYNNLGLQYSGGASNLITSLDRVQSCNYSLQIPRVDVNQFGELGAIDRVILQQPPVNLDINYVLANFANEQLLGLTVTPTGSTQQISCISGLLTQVTDNKNYFIVEAAEGQDVNNNSLAALNVSTTKVYGIGNGFLSSYTSQGSVGNLPTVDVRIEGLNFIVTTGLEGTSIPAINPADGSRISGWYYRLTSPTSNDNPGTGDLAISTLRHGDMTLTVFQSGTNVEYSEFGATPSPVSGAVQGYRFSYDLRREDLTKLGTRFAYSKQITYPLSVSCSLNGLVRDLNTGDLSAFICSDNTYDVELAIKRPGCDANRPVVARYRLLGAKLDGQSYNSSIGPNKTFTLDFSRQIGSASQNVGLFLSGVVSNLPSGYIG